MISIAGLRLSMMAAVLLLGNGGYFEKLCKENGQPSSNCRRLV